MRNYALCEELNELEEQRARTSRFFDLRVSDQIDCRIKEIKRELDPPRRDPDHGLRGFGRFR